MPVPTIIYTKGNVRLIDQTKLPGSLEYIDCSDVKTLWDCIKRLNVRGAPALGVAAGFGVLLGLKEFKGKTVKQLVKHVYMVCKYIGTSRPTAVNLFNSLERMKFAAATCLDLNVGEAIKQLHIEAMEIFNEDKEMCRKIGSNGEKFIRSGQTVLTVCNAGALATADYGTALGVMYAAKAKGKKFKVYSCETRPLLQGARLTTWELLKAKIDTTLICDNMAATLMKQKKIDLIIAGADRIASNGDAANKIGTYSLAVLAKYHKIPFYIAAPYSTFDMTIDSGKDIPIEERDSDEVRGFGGMATAPKNVKVYNPAFDVTDHELITAIITEFGIISPVNKSNIKAMFK
ncbi:MAG: S-methyl-5-thioribose-1-phosphate isomerase [Omnitrophica WOR_2 bacterium GWF2_38_59]|nr:MAG: S-methyl-5-thioribose-1-phosphate isomerase [Omnitrophica WOR_2 bacterium GWF2_38_59]OGX49782.1 MAG: S-methyl-5-thioribose-1-phosphate isomerase [Omnitrophica WOR_2 bacterium RIFOXYA2_FULL_38_17]OGX58292.1 MAG: S-methyl-5-thioribose-1-phosphate isomerase [Omnitrophica WOR_2 bacterium RIFOXYB2_FULL_38_16]HBG61388.1 S-methyl-5-thioribose-1-phosphate isomerase [Candidatus Omnitrophota bacterium]